MRYRISIEMMKRSYIIKQSFASSVVLTMIHIANMHAV
jgi:hypothetical protein